MRRLDEGRKVRVLMRWLCWRQRAGVLTTVRDFQAALRRRAGRCGRPALAWWADHQELAALLRWLEEQHGYTSSTEIIPVLEKPWKWQPEYDEMKEAGR